MAEETFVENVLPPEGLYESREALSRPLILGLSLVDMHSQLGSPLKLQAGESKLPPAYIQIAGADPLRDGGFAYAGRLHIAG